METNKEMAEYIYSILLSQPIILMSWGFHSPKATHQGLSFLVNGFIHKGKILIQYNEGSDLFDIKLISVRNIEKKLIEGIYFDQLIEVIDENVEHVKNYEARVRKEYY